MAGNPEEAESAAPSLTESFAEAICAYGNTDLAPELVAKAKLCLADYLANAFESRQLPWAEQAVRMAVANAGNIGSEESPQRATIIGTRFGVARGDAAFANAVLGHGLVRDDMHLGSVSHLGVVVFPPALALTELLHPSGPTFLAAIVAGYEAGGKLGRAILDVDVARIHRPTGITGPFAGAAAAARIGQLSVDRCAAALGLAANAAAGYNEWAATGGSEMFFHPGFAARNALTAVALAGAGAQVSSSALEGSAGMLSAFGKQWPAALPAPFSGEAEISTVFFKEVPACNFAQSAAQAARDLALDADFAASSIESISVRVPHAAAAYPGCDAPGPFEHVLQAKMSIHYNVAAALLRKGFDEKNYAPAENQDIARLAASIVLTVDDTLSAAFPGRQGASVEARLAGGRRFEAHANDVRPASDTLVRERFAAAASAALGTEPAEQLAGLIDGLELSEDVAALIRLCRASASELIT